MSFSGFPSLFEELDALHSNYHYEYDLNESLGATAKSEPSCLYHNLDKGYDDSIYSQFSKSELFASDALLHDEVSLCEGFNLGSNFNSCVDYNNTNYSAISTEIDYDASNLSAPSATSLSPYSSPSETDCPRIMNDELAFNSVSQCFKEPYKVIPTPAEEVLDVNLLDLNTISISSDINSLDYCNIDRAPAPCKRIPSVDPTIADLPKISLKSTMVAPLQLTQESSSFTSMAAVDTVDNEGLKPLCSTSSTSCEEDPQNLKTELENTLIKRENHSENTVSTLPINSSKNTSRIILPKLNITAVQSKSNVMKLRPKRRQNLKSSKKNACVDLPFSSLNPKPTKSFIKKQRAVNKCKAYELSPLNDPKLERCRQNAINAKKHRELKRQRMEELEKRLEIAEAEKAEMSQKYQRLQEQNEFLQMELKELKAAIQGM